jgi:hypothetical protein
MSYSWVLGEQHTTVIRKRCLGYIRRQRNFHRCWILARIFRDYSKIYRTFHWTIRNQTIITLTRMVPKKNSTEILVNNNTRAKIEVILRNFGCPAINTRKRQLKIYNKWVLQKRVLVSHLKWSWKTITPDPCSSI